MLDIKSDFEIIIRYLKDKAFDVIDRFVIQIGSPQKYREIIKIHKFKYFHYNFSVDGNLNYNLRFVVKNKIQSCSVAIKNVKSSRTLRYLKKYNIKSFAYTVNDIVLWQKLKKYGVYGIMSDNLELNEKVDCFKEKNI